MTDIINILTAEAVELLKEMIAIPSPSFHEEAVCSHISQWLTTKGIEHERIGNNIVAEHISDSNAPTLMLCAHIDTVDPCEGYSFDPYTPEDSTEGIIQGLGSNDDGASVVSMIAAYRFFSDTVGSGAGVKNNPSHDSVAAVRCKSPLDYLPIAHDPCGQRGSTVFTSVVLVFYCTTILRRGSGAAPE